MEDGKLEALIIERLKNGDNLNDILVELCESANMDWRQAQDLVERIRAENNTNITMYQSPLLILIALAIFLGGVGLIVYTAASLVTMYEFFMAPPPQPNTLLPETGFITYVAVSASQLFFYIFLGMGMILGSAKGMAPVWTAVFEKIGIFQSLQ